MLDYRVFTFIKVCETLNFTQAAKELHITQPAVTKHFKTQLKQDLQPLNFGATLTIGEYVLTDSLVDILANHPNFQVKMLVDNTETLLKAIDKGEIDFALIEGFFSKEKYDFLPLAPSHHLLLQSPHFP